MNVSIDFCQLEKFFTEELIIKGNSYIKKIEENKQLGFTDLPENEEYAEICLNLVNSLDKEIDTLLVLGIGGSALGTSMVLDAIPEKVSKKIIVLDNVDPNTIEKVSKSIQPEKTIINVVSKSGGTVEPISQFKYFFKQFEEELGKEKAINHCVLTTDKEKGVLRKLANNLNFKTLPIPENVGGRFSILTPVSLFPLAFAGIDIKKLLKGAKTTKDNGSVLAIKSAILDFKMYLDKKNIKILFPYSDRLFTFGQWYLQLFGESLGKKLNNLGETVHTGQTAVLAKGVTDQHSQLQLYMEGPKDKYIGFFKVEEMSNVIIPDTFNEFEGFTLTSNKTFKQLMDAEFTGTFSALEKEGVPVFKYILKTINEETIGELIYLFELQTALTGSFLNINAFDQPGVEAGKIIAKEILNS